MILEIVLDAILPFLFRVFGYVFIELFSYGVFYFTGLAVLKVCTLGRFPEQYYWERGRSGQDSFAILVGLLVWMLLLLVVLLKYTG